MNFKSQNSHPKSLKNDSKKLSFLVLVLGVMSLPNSSFAGGLPGTPPVVPGLTGPGGICYRALQIIQDYSRTTEVRNTEIAFRNSLDITHKDGVDVAHKEVLTTVWQWLKIKKGFGSLTFSEMLVDGRHRNDEIDGVLKIIGVPLNPGSKGLPDFWSIRLNHAEVGERGVDGRRWVVDVGVSKVDGKVVLQTSEGFYQAVPQLGFAPPPPVPGAPKFVRDLLQSPDSLDVAVGGFSIKAKRAFGITREEQFKKFLALLSNPSRRVPVFVVSIDEGGHALNPNLLAEKLWGVGPVFYETHDFSLSQGFVQNQVHQSLSVWNGAVRIYMPGFLPTDPVSKHSVISQPVVERMIRIQSEEGYIDHLAKQVGTYVDQTQYVYNIPGSEYLRAQLSVELLRAKVVAGASAPPTSGGLQNVGANPAPAPKVVSNEPKKALPRLEIPEPVNPVKTTESQIRDSTARSLSALRSFSQSEELSKHQAEIASLKNQIQQLKDQNQGIQNQLDQALADSTLYQQIANDTGTQNQILLDRVNPLEDSLNEAKREIENLQAQVKSLTEALQHSHGGGGASSAAKSQKTSNFVSILKGKYGDILDINPSESFRERKRKFLEEIESIGPRYEQSDLMDRFSELFGDRVLVLDEAFDSASKHPMDLSYLADMLMAVADQAWAGRFEKNLSGKKYQDFVVENSGYKYSSNETQRTMDKYGEYRRFNLPLPNKGFQDGKPVGSKAVKVVEFQGHMKHGKGRAGNKMIRIYFGFDEDAPNKVVVGHVGDHLPSISEDNF